MISEKIVGTLVEGVASVIAHLNHRKIKTVGANGEDN
jgi:hypothetical protein